MNQNLFFIFKKFPYKFIGFLEKSDYILIHAILNIHPFISKFIRKGFL